MKPPKKPGTLANRVTIRMLLGITKQGVHLATLRDDFPAPLDVLDDGQPIWRLKDVERYAEKRRNGKR